jgi:Uncharacterized conserved protein (COG2071)
VSVERTLKTVRPAMTEGVIMSAQPGTTIESGTSTRRGSAGTPSPATHGATAKPGPTTRFGPTVDAVIDRRILVNYTIDPDVARALVPAPFRPNLAFGRAIAGICLIRLARLRPHGFPRWASASSENAAHRIAVEWDTPEGVMTGVYVPRRDTDSRLALLAGGRVFPGDQHRALFGVQETPGRYRIAVASTDGHMSLSLDARNADTLPSTSIFTGLDSASAFFRCDRDGYSPSRRHDGFDAMRLEVDNWRVTPLACDSVRSSFFEDRDAFPRGSAVFDHALVMHKVAARWVPRPRLASR